MCMGTPIGVYIFVLDDILLYGDFPINLVYLIIYPNKNLGKLEAKRRDRTRRGSRQK